MLGVVNSSSTDNGPIMARVGIAMMVLSGFSVACRFLARRLEKLPFWWDDWLILMALVPAWACIIPHIIGVYDTGYGRHMTELSSGEIVEFFKMLYIVQLTYPIAIAFIKFSIIAFFRRVFAVASTRIPLYTLTGIVGLWMIAVLFPAIFSCNPVQGFWMRTLEPVCINTITYYMGLAIPNIVTDFVIMLFPMPMIWQLQMPRSQKIALTAIFTIGGFIIIISILRLATILESQDSTDETWVLLPLGLFNAIELAVGIMLACLPSMRPLLRFILRQSVRSTNRQTPQLGQSGNSGSKQTYWKSIGSSSRKTLPNDDASFTRLNESQINDVNLNGYAGKGNGVKVSVDTDLELGVLSGVGENGKGIMVRRETEWEYHNAS